MFNMIVRKSIVSDITLAFTTTPPVAIMKNITASAFLTVAAFARCARVRAHFFVKSEADRLSRCKPCPFVFTTLSSGFSVAVVVCSHLRDTSGVVESATVEAVPDATSI